LYEKLIAQSGHFKVWISYALFEAERIRVPRDERGEDEDEEDENTWAKDEGDPGRARELWERGYKDLKAKGLKNEVRIQFKSKCLGYF
jgi:crooked neck